MGFSALYAKFRGSPAFVWAVTIFVGCWLTLHFLTDDSFDHGLGILNLILSSEASISVALLIMSGERSQKNHAQQMKYLLGMTEYIKIAIIKINEAIEENERLRKRMAAVHNPRPIRRPRKPQVKKSDS